MTDAPAFGAFAPTGLRRAVMALGALTGPGRAGKLARSALFRLADGYGGRPADVVLFGTERGRLHPSDNLSEKRVFIAPHLWDAAERAYLSGAVAGGTGPFRFADVGANAGLYTLAVHAAARAAGRPLRGLAVEPQLAMLERLRFNLAASGAAEAVTVCPWAATATACRLRLSQDRRNRGAAAVAESGDLAIEGRPLADALAAAGLDGLDAMKIDIEGHEAPALSAFFDAVPRAGWPRAMVIEAREGAGTGLSLCLGRGYAMAGRTRLNALLRLDG